MADVSVGAQTSSKKRRRLAWAGLLLIMLAVLAIVLIPAWLIQPFRAQTRGGMELSYTLRRWSPLFTLIAAAGALAIVVWLWRGARRWWRKGALVLMLLVTGLGAWLARQNHFEWMFNPLPNPAYARAGEAGFVADDDRVMAVEVGGESVAYPIRLMAYHHLVQDNVGGTHVVATY